MRVTHYLSRFKLAYGGVVRAVLDMCTVLSRRGHDIQVITWDGTDIPQAWKSGQSGYPKLVEVDRPTVVGLLPQNAMRVIARSIRSTDILHLHTPWDVANRQFSKLARQHGCPYILTIHGMLDDWSMAQRRWKKRAYLKLGGRALLEDAAAVHCTAQGELDQASKWFPKTRGCVIPLVFDVAPFRELPGPGIAQAAIPQANTDKPIVLFLGRLNFKKRLEILIDAAAILRDHGERFRVLIAGKGNDAYVARLCRRIKRLDLDDRVFFVGLVVGRTKSSLYELAEVFVLPSSQENFGFVYPESLACRTPVITTKGTDIWQELESSGGAIIVDGTAESLADAIRQILADPNRSNIMGDQGRNWVFNELGNEKTVRHLEQMYRSRFIEQSGSNLSGTALHGRLGNPSRIAQHRDL